jgi:hypothetical protein
MKHVDRGSEAGDTEKKGQASMRRFCIADRERFGWVLGAVMVLAWCGAARPDVIVLRGGGEIQGKVIPDPKKPDTVHVLLLKGKNPLSFLKKQILQVIPRESPLDTYLVKREKVGPTAQAEYELGLWCEQNQLVDLAKVHYEAALGYDKAFEPAHKKLGHVEHDGQWLSRDELRQVQGLVKYKGKWVTEEERAKRDESAQVTAAQASWVRRIKLLRQAIANGSPDRRREAEHELMQITEPEAVLPLVRVLGRDEVPMRMLLAHVLGGIAGKESARALVNMVLAEPEDEVRSSVLERLKEREEPGIVPQLAKALGSENIKVVNRAAWTLGNLDAVTSVPKLVGSLISTEERIVMVPQEGAAQGTNPAGLGLSPAMMAFNGSSIAYLTPPAVGPGVVAYGAYTAPFYNPAQLSGNSVLGVGAAPNRGPTLRAVTFTYENTEVLGALIKLTGQDFGYDAAAWRRWIKASFNPNPKPVRQVPQP